MLAAVEERTGLTPRQRAKTAPQNEKPPRPTFEESPPPAPIDYLRIHGALSSWVLLMRPVGLCSEGLSICWSGKGL